jgi:putative membrane protein
MIRNSARILKVVAFVALSATLACGPIRGRAATPSQPVQVTGATVPTPPAPSMVLTASDIFGIVQEQTKADLNEARLAVHMAKNVRVKKFAEQVVRDEMAREARQNDLMKGLGIAKPTDTMISIHLREAGDVRLGQLRAMRGAEFDRAFVDGQVDTYRALLDSYDKNLIPNARDPRIKESLETWRARAERRLAEAQALRGVLARQ